MAVFRVKDRVSLSRSSGETLVVRSTKSRSFNHSTNQSSDEPTCLPLPLSLLLLPRTFRWRRRLFFFREISGRFSSFAVFTRGYAVIFPKRGCKTGKRVIPGLSGDPFDAFFALQKELLGRLHPETGAVLLRTLIETPPEDPVHPASGNSVCPREFRNGTAVLDFLLNRLDQRGNVCRLFADLIPNLQENLERGGGRPVQKGRILFPVPAAGSSARPLQ